MAHKCFKCGFKTIFFVWSSSAVFPARKFIKEMEIKSKYERNKIIREGVPICFGCFNDLK